MRARLCTQRSAERTRYGSWVENPARDSMANRTQYPGRPHACPYYTAQLE